MAHSTRRPPQVDPSTGKLIIDYPLVGDEHAARRKSTVTRFFEREDQLLQNYFYWQIEMFSRLCLVRTTVFLFVFSRP